METEVSNGAECSPPRRKFGTHLKGNNASPGPRSSVKKARVVVRRASPALPSLPEATGTSSGGLRTYIVTFAGGPIGLQLEPIALASSGASKNSKQQQHYCRVQRFVNFDDGREGQAQKSGRIEVGDLVLRVNGIQVESYQQAIHILKQNKDTTREIEFGRRAETAHSSADGRAESTQNANGDDQHRRRQKSDSWTRKPSPPAAGATAPSSKPGWVRRLGPSTPESSFDTDASSLEGQPTPEISNVKKKEHHRQQSTTSAVAPVVSALQFDILDESTSSDVNDNLAEDDNGTTAAICSDSLVPRELMLSISPKKFGNSEKSNEEKRAALEPDDGDDDPTPKHANFQLTSSEDKLSLAELRAELERERQQRDGLESQLRRVRDEHEAKYEKQRRELETTQQQLQERTRDLEESEGRVTVLQREKKELQSRTETLQRQNQALQGRCETEAAKNRKSTTDFEDTVIALERAQRELDALKQTSTSQIDVLRQENQRLRTQVEENRKKYTKALVARQSSPDDPRVNDLERETTTLRENILKKDSSLREWKEKAETVQGEFQRFREEIQATTEAKDQELSQVKNDRQRLQMLLEEAQKQVSQHRTSVAALEALVESKDQELDQLSEALVRLERENETLASQVSELQSTSAQQETLRTRLRNLELELERARDAANPSSDENELESAARLLKDKERELSQARSQLRAANGKIERLAAELKETHSSLADAERERREHCLREKRRTTEIESQINTKFHNASVLSKAEISELQRQVRALESSKRTLNRELESLTKTNDELSSQLDSVQKNLDASDNKLSAKTVECMTHINLLEDARDELNQKSDELAAVQRALATVTLQYEEMSSRLSNATEESSKEKDTLVSALHNVQEELDASKTRCTELERFLRSMRRTASDAEARLSQARELLSQERQNTRQLLRAGETSNKALVEKLERYKELSQKTEKERDLFRAEVGSLERKIVSLQDEMKSLKDRHAKSEAETVREKESILLNLTSEKAKTDNLSEQLRASELKLAQKVRDAESKMQRYEECLRFARVDFESKSRKQQEVLQKKEDEIRNLSETKEELRNSRSEIVRLEESLRRSKQETEELSAAVDEIQDENTCTIQRMIKSHNLEIERMSKRQEELQQAARKLDERRESAEMRLYAAEEGLLAARSERERLIDEKNQLQSALSRAQAVESSLCAELEALQQQCDKSVCSSDDESESHEFSGLSKSELKTKCRDLREQLHSAHMRANSSTSSIVQRDEQLGRLQQDLELLQNELENLVETNGRYEDRLIEARASAEDATSAAAASRSRLAMEEERVRSLEQRLEEKSREIDSLHENLRSAEEKFRSVDLDYAAREEEMANEIAVLRQLTAEAEADKFSSAEELLRKEDEIAKAEKTLKETRRQIERLEQELSNALEEKEKAIIERDRVQSETAGNADQFKNQIFSFIKRIGDLEVEVEDARVELERKNEKERVLSLALENQRQELLEKEEEVVSKLAQASRVVVSQKQSIHELEIRKTESERTASSLSNQIVQLQETIKKLESSAEVTGDLRLKQLQDFEDKRLLWEQERAEAKAEANSLRNELRTTRRRSSDAEKRNESLQSRLDATKKALDKTKKQLSETRAALEEVELSSKKLQNELESKRHEADSLKARAQLLNATVARLRSDQLLKESALQQAEFKENASENEDAQVARLRAEIKAKSSKIESLSEVYYSQQLVLSMSQNLENQLLRFIEDTIRQVAGAFNKISSHQADADGSATRAELPLHLRGLALAGIEWPESRLKADSYAMDGLASVIPNILTDLEAKRSQLHSLKKQRAARSLPKIETPQQKTRQSAPDTPSIMDALQSIKRVLNDQVLSPQKSHRTDAGLAEYFHKVIHSLEAQIDGLLVDLKSANDALQAKDQLFADLEHLVAHHEMERNRLEQKLKREVAWKRASEKQLTVVREQLRKAKDDASALVSSTTSKGDDNGNKAAKVAAGRLIAKFVQSRHVQDKSAAFRQWACQTSAAKAVDQQQSIASELTQQLDSTREKLGALKAHLKKQRSAGGLNRISEHGYETT